MIYKFLCSHCHVIFEDEYINGQILFNYTIDISCPLCGHHWKINKS